MKPKPFIFNNGPVTPADARIVFGLLWTLMFILYLPAARAGFVTDFTGWLNQIENAGFWEYINRTHFQAHSLYQFTQFVTYIFYKLFGIHAWLWHLLFITLHAANAALIFRFCAGLLYDSGEEKGKLIALGGASLFCISPYISEVIVWEPSFHFLLGLLLILLILNYVQKYIHTGKNRYVWTAVLIYFLSIFSLEVFYITPWLALGLGIFYSLKQPFGKPVAIRVIKYFFFPMFLLFLFRLALYRVIYGGWVSRIGTGAVTGIGAGSFGKPAKYLFHLLFLGRFFSYETKQAVYTFCDSTKGLALFYGVIILLCVFIITRFRKMDGKAKTTVLLLIYTFISLALLIPLWFGDLLLVIYDRYTYFTGAFLYMALAILFSRIKTEYIRLGVVSLFVLANLRFTILVNRYWAKSSHIIHNLLYNIPDRGGKILVLLNLPDSFNGIPMIGSEKESEYKLMHNLLLPDHKFNGPVYDGLSYNMLTPADGAHTTVIADSVIRVTLNQWGTWWWYEGKGGNSYENNDYKLNMIDGGHFYELTLKKPSKDYLLLYQVGDEWKVVDMAKKGLEQD